MRVAFSYRIDSARRLATATLSGTVRGVDIAEGIRAIYEDAAWQPGFGTLWECTGIGELLFEADDLPTFVRLQKEFADRAGDGPEVILVARPLDGAMAQMYAVMMRDQSRKVHVCRTAAEAESLLARGQGSLR